MKDKIFTIIFCIIIFGFGIINIIIPDKDISYSERRKLTTLPKFTIENVFNDTITDKLDTYISDHFIFRDTFRKVKAYTLFNILNMNDYNNLYMSDDYIFKIDYPLNEDKVIQFTNKMNNLYNTYLKNMNVYYSIIPDKNYYSNTNNLKIDYDKLFNIVNSNMNNNMTYIDITNCLQLNDYYYTDIHWKQESLNKVVNKLSESMKFNISNNYKENTYYPFYGSYYGQIGISAKPDTLTYLTNDTIENAIVKDIESDTTKVYETESLGKIDSYDVFLSGATPIIEINNKNKTHNKELIIFRDSFSSSLTPLLINGYDKITLIDLRYINSNLLKDHIKFNNQDILLLYNTEIINNSDILK